ncbi:MAG: nuclear transport factor 2 family protein [Parvibaculum sp.]|nr:nuclear transport factor 2 family protein [Parvibaculum sp.]
MSDVMKLAEKFVSAIEAGDIEAVKDCYAPDAQIWHNFDDVNQSVTDNLKVLKWMSGVLSDRHYAILRRVEIPGGYMQQHVLHGKLKNGAPFSMSACLVIQVEDGRIKRLEEYLDVAQAAALRA